MVDCTAGVVAGRRPVADAALWWALALANSINDEI